MFNRIKRSGAVVATVFATLLLAAPAAQAQQLNLLCNATIDWCELMKNKFEAETGIKTNMVRRSSGESYAQVRAESANPKTDIWWGGTGDPHLQAAAEGLTEVYKSPMLAKQQPWSTTRSSSHRKSSRLQNVGAIWQTRNTRTKCKCQTRILRARLTRCSPRWCS